MIEEEFIDLFNQIKVHRCEHRTLEIKSAHKGCPERLYDTFSSFSNQNDGGIIVFGIDEKQDFQAVGVYDAQDLQKKLMEVGESMCPKVRPVLSVFCVSDLLFVTAEIPPVDPVERPCFKEAKGRLKGSYVRVGDGDKPMTEYEVYSYEAYRKKCRDDIRPIEGISIDSLDETKLGQYLMQRQINRQNLSALPREQLYELTGITNNNQLTLAANLLFSIYPQAFFPQLCIIATVVPGTEKGIVDEKGNRFIDSRRIEGTLPEMLEAAIQFVRNNMKNALRIHPITGVRENFPEYPMDAVREIILNALVHRDYSVHTENKPIELVMYSNRVEVTNPGGLYGRLSIDQLGEVQPDTRNPILVMMMETLGQTENRYSGIPRIKAAVKERNLPEPVFKDVRGAFTVCLYNDRTKEKSVPASNTETRDVRGLLHFCRTPKTRQEISAYLNIKTVQYAMKQYIDPLIEQNLIQLSIPERPRSSKQVYQTNATYFENEQ